MKRLFVYLFAFLASKTASASLGATNDLMDVNQHPNKFGYQNVSTNRDLLIRDLVEKNQFDLEGAQVYVEQLSDKDVLELMRSLGTPRLEQISSPITVGINGDDGGPA